MAFDIKNNGREHAAAVDWHFILSHQISGYGLRVSHLGESANQNRLRCRLDKRSIDNVLNFDSQTLSLM